MSIWIDLLLLHGYIATPAGLALITRADATTAVDPAPPAPPEARVIDRSESFAHALRTMGQLR